MSTPNLDATYGAMLIGLLFATFFQGVLSVQAYIFYESFPEDGWGIKSLVAGVWCLDLLHLVLIAQGTYHYLVTNWGNTQALLFSTWELDLHLAVIGLATIVCQGFFLRRIWIFSGKNTIITGVLASLCLATLGLDITISVQIIQVPLVTQFRAITPEVIALFSMGAGVDVIIALILFYYLHRGRGEFNRTNTVVAKVIQYTIATGLASSMLALASLIAFLARPNTFIYIAIHFSLGRMYTNALLATLNSRRRLRAILGQREDHFTPGGKPSLRGFSDEFQSAVPAYTPESLSFPRESPYRTRALRSVDTTGSQKISAEYSVRTKGSYEQGMEMQPVGQKQGLALTV